ncbi:MAG: hypothetical protein HND53_11315 [Proteobacteria bacterium]|nr:hypothetical protein [Pseudomonadota bacterium]NOG61081.1 hypothetical protein [Pseudomonadota bacterium]
MKNKGEFPRLDQARLNKLLNLYRELHEQSIEAENDFRKVSLEKWEKIIPSPARWSVFYEIPYLHNLLFLFKWIGVLDEYQTAVKTDDPINSVLTFLDNVDEIVIKEGEEPKGGIDESTAILSWIAISKQLKSWMIHGKTLSKLNEEIGEGSFSSLYKALEIDPSIIATANASHLFSIGLLQKNKKRFIGTISKKMSSQLARHDRSMQELRFMLTAITEIGDFDIYSQSDRYKLFVEDLQIYSSRSRNENTKDEFDSLNQFIRDWRRNAEIYEYDVTKTK